MALEPGSICLIEHPFSDKAVAKLRPVLVVEPIGGVFLAITDGAGSPAGNHAVFLPITSRVVPGRYNIVIDASSPHFGAAGLKVASTILCWSVNTIHKAMVKREIGKAPPELMAEVRNRLRALLSL